MTTLAGGDMSVSSIQSDASGNTVIVGWYYNTTDFDYSSGTDLATSSGNEDIFIQKSDAAGNYLFTNRIGNTGFDGANDVCLDATGNIYVVGYFSDTVDFDPGPGVMNLKVDSLSDIFFAKYDPMGNLIFAKSIGGKYYDAGYFIDLDASGNIIISGTFSSTADFDPSSTIHNMSSAGGTDIFFAKYDPSGNFIYSKRIGNSSNDAPSAMALDNFSNLLMATNFGGTFDADPGTGIANFSGLGSTDILLCKYDSTGNYVWGKQIGGTSTDQCAGITIQADGTACITGTFKGTPDFDPSASTFTMSSFGGYDIFISGYDSSGNMVFAKQIGGSSDDIGTCISSDNSGNLYISGNFNGSCDFDPSGTTSILSTTYGGNEPYLAKYTSTGNYVSAFNLKNFEQTNVYGIDGKSVYVNSASNIFLAGQFFHVQNLANGTPSHEVVGADNNQTVFVAKYDTVLNFQWGHSIIGNYTSPYVGCSDFVMDNAKNSYIVGGFKGLLDFGAGAPPLYSAGSGNAFLAKIDSTGTVVFTRSFLAGSGSGSAISVGLDTLGNIIIAGQYSGNCDFDPGPYERISSSVSGPSFLLKLDASGNYIDHATFGSGFSLMPQGPYMKIDKRNNIFITGTYRGTGDMDAGAGTSTLTSVGGGDDFYIAKYTPSLDFTYTKGVGGIGADVVRSIVLDDTANIYLTGYITNTVDFDPGPGSVLLSSSGNPGIFIAKYDSLGNYSFAKAMSGLNNNQPYVIRLDHSNNILITGYFLDSCDFDPGPGVHKLYSPPITNGDPFLAKYDNQGNYKFAINTGFDAIGFALDIDANDNSFVAGSFAGSSDFDPGTSSYYLNAVGNDDFFIAKYDSIGNFNLAMSVGGSGVESVTKIISDQNGAVYCKGNFQQTVDFNAGVGYNPLTNAGTNPGAFIAKYREGGITTSTGTLTDSKINFMIYPNPFTRYATVVFEKNQVNSTLTISDLTGRLIRTDIINGDRYVIDKGSLVNGIYFVQLVDRLNQRSTCKIIVQ